MRTKQFQTARYRISGIAPAGVQPEQCLESPKERLAAVMAALEDIGKLISNQCFSRPDALTQDSITTYALALMQLRECACAAGLGRLTKACDALAVTVARLIEDKNCACHQKCDALTRFVAHAHAMIQLSAEMPKHQTLPIAVAYSRVERALNEAGRHALQRVPH